MSQGAEETGLEAEVAFKDEEKLARGDESSESEEDEEEEPKLKFERIGNDMVNILNKDAASCMTVHPKFLAVGTHWGMIHILDHLGNRIDRMEINAHTTTVNQLSIDSSGEYIASCSDDGRVVITGLYSSDHDQKMEMNRPVKSVALEPGFAKQGSSRLFVTGDHDKLVLHERGGFFTRHKQVELHSGEGAVRCVKWRGHYIAWANDKGVKVYDLSIRAKISFIDKEHKLRPELFRCNLFWKDDNTLLLAWADRVKVCVVKERVAEPAHATSPHSTAGATALSLWHKTPAAASASTSGGGAGEHGAAGAPHQPLPPRYVEIQAMFTLDAHYVCGVASMGANLVLLTYSKHSQPGSAERPELQIVSPYQEYYDYVYNGSLSLRGFEECRANDYHLECVQEECLYFVISPKDIIISKPRTEDDHVQWLLEHDRYEQALEATINYDKLLKHHTLLSVGRQYLEHLLTVTKDHGLAATLCVKILGKNRELWEEYVYKFARIKQLKCIAPYLPRSKELTLDPAIYEMVLNEFVGTGDIAGFQGLIREWPHSLYNVAAIVALVKSTLNPLDTIGGVPAVPELTLDQQNVLLHTLGELYSAQGDHDRALEIYLRLKHKDAFQLIHRHSLFNNISDKIVLLMEFDTQRAVQLLLDNQDKVPIDTVVHQLSQHSHLLHAYLHGVWAAEPHNPAGRKYHGQMVALFARYDRPALLSFLRSSSDVPLQQALLTCQQQGLVPECVFLLGRMGDVKQALSLIITGLQDIDRAIAFCKEHDEQDLWEDLISQSLDKPTFIRVLLHNIGTHVDPIMLIRRIKPGLEIPRLRDSLVKILHDYNLQISLREGCKKILVSDSYNLFDKLVSTQRRGVRVEDQVCPECNNAVVVNNMRFAASITVFYCSHVFHDECLHSASYTAAAADPSTQSPDDVCPLCTAAAAAATKRTANKVRPK